MSKAIIAERDTSVYGSVCRLVLPEKQAEPVLERKRVRPLQDARKIRVGYWPQSDIINKIESLQ